MPHSAPFLLGECSEKKVFIELIVKRRQRKTMYNYDNTIWKAGGLFLRRQWLWIEDCGLWTEEDVASAGQIEQIFGELSHKLILGSSYVKGKLSLN